MTRARTLWEEGTEPGRQIVVLGIAVTLTVVSLDMLLDRGLGLMFDFVFVGLCVTLALMVRPGDFFTVGVLPPLLMLGVFVLIGALDPGTVARAQDGTIQAVVTGLATHATALALGYGLALGCLAMRIRMINLRQNKTWETNREPALRASGQESSKRAGSPAPTLTTSG